MREEIARMIDNELSGFGSYSVALGLADRILDALAAAAREGRDGTARGETRQSGGDSRNAQPPPPSKDIS